MAVLRWIVVLPLAAACIAFALANRESVLFTYSPFHPSVESPVYLLALGMLAAGFLLGSVMTWLGMGKLRKDRRALRRTVKELEKNLDAANETALETGTSPDQQSPDQATGPPVLPPVLKDERQDKKL